MFDSLPPLLLALIFVAFVAVAGAFLAWHAYRTIAAGKPSTKATNATNAKALALGRDDVDTAISDALDALKLPNTPALRSGIMFCATAVLMLVIAYVARQQIAVLVYKAALMTMAGFVGYWIDRSLFPTTRPHLIPDLPLRAQAEFRRALIVLGCLIASSIGA